METFQLVVRGTDATGLAIERVRTVTAATLPDAWLAFADHVQDMCEGLRSPQFRAVPEIRATSEKRQLVH